jgi:tetratricopeptide (TPR) repeat protein
MNRTSARSPSARLDTRSIDRLEAARLLRAVRSDEGPVADEALDWAFGIMPESAHPRRLLIERLLSQGDHRTADTMIAQGLLLRPDDPALSRLRAESLLMQEQPGEAEIEIRRALRRRPNHVRTLRTAASVAEALGKSTLRASYLERALAARPQSGATRVELVNALLDAGCIGRASRMLKALGTRHPLLESRVLAAQGRVLDAISLLEQSRIDGDSDVSLTVELIAVLERAGDRPRLRRLLKQIDDQADVLTHAGRGWLLLGQFRTAIIRLAPLRWSRSHAREALSIIAVAAAMLQRHALAERALARLQVTARGASPARLAELWRRALAARVLDDQLNARRAGQDRNASLLEPLLQSAVATLSRASQSARGAQRGELQRHRAICLMALGRDREAAQGFAASVPQRRSEPTERRPTSFPTTRPPARRAA